MDQRRSKAIRRFILIWGISAILLTAGVLLVREFQVRNTENQMQELFSIYPEQTGQLRENFSYYNRIRDTIFVIVWAIGLLLSPVFSGMVIYFLSKEMTDEEKKTENILQLLTEQMERYRRSDFTTVISPCDIEGLRMKEEWENIHNQLRELGYYFQSMKEQLEIEENNTKTMISDIAHQLKTPLASLRMSYELAQEDGMTPEEKEEFIQKEEVEIHRLELLIEELVKLSRLENHMIRICPKEQGIRKTLTEAVNMVFAKALEKSIQIHVDMIEDVIVRHDDKWTAEAIANVLDNAIKYSGPRTVISVIVRTLPNLLIIDIEDEGIGILSGELHKIFQRFYRGEKAAAYAGDGAGIGLYLSRKIIEEQKGMIVAKSRPERGTVFRITLPL